jgi:regulator of sigma E protease
MMNILSNTLAFIVALGVIIFVHEAGHLFVAKAFRMKVKTFSLGFGKRIWGFKRGETDYRVSLVPLGGYVALGGEDPSEVSDDPREFLNKPRWQRILVYLAGPAMNIVLAVALMAGVLMVGIEVSSLPEIPARIGNVAVGSPGEAAGLLPGDRITTVNGKGVTRWDDLQFAILTSPDVELQLAVDRDGRSLDVSLTPLRVPKYEFGDAGIFPEILPRIAQVMPDTPALAAGFQAGDEILGVDGRPLVKWEEFVEIVEAHAGQAIDVEVLRLGEPISIRVIPADEDGKGKIGVRPGYYQRLGPVDALAESVRFNYGIARQTFAVLGKIITGKLAAKSALSGPIEIAALSGAAARSGMEYLVQLMGLISISIAILNLLPIPVLDGGQIAILLVESLRRRDLSLKIKERINQVGFVMIVALMAVVLFFDLVKNIPAGLLPGS